MALGLLLTACSTGHEDSLRIRVRDPVLTLDPQTRDDRPTLSVLSNVYDALVGFDADNGVVPSLAASWSNPSDETWRFELRRDVRFHDGRALSPRDVKYTIDRALDHPRSALRPELAQVKGASVVGPWTVDVSTRGPAPLLLSRLSNLLVLPEGADPETSEHANGTGPYRVLAWRPSGRLALAGFDAHWRGRPAWRRVVIEGEPDPEARMAALENGEADLVDHPPESVASRLRTGGATQLFEHPAARVAVLGFRVKAEPGNPFADARVRRAVALAIDRRALIRDALEGWGRVPTQLAPPGAYGYVSELPEIRSDADAAREALRRSRFPDGFEASLAYGEANGLLATALAAQLRPLGVRLTLAPTPWPELDRAMQLQSVPAYLFYVTFSTLETGPVLEGAFHTRHEAAARGMMNFSAFSDPVTDALLERIESEVEPGMRLELLQEAMRTTMAADVWLPLAVQSRLYGARRGLVWQGSLSGKLDLQAIREAPRRRE